MKKRIVFLCILAITVSFSACGKAGDTNPENTDNEAQSQTEEETPSADSYFSWDSDNVLISLTESGREQDTLVIPAKCTGISSGALSGSAAKKITFEDDDDIGDIASAFFGVNSLEQIRLPEGQKVIGDMAFSDCAALEEITIPAKTETIGNYAFSGCASLKKVDFAGTDLKEIGENAFEYCAIESLELPEGLETIKVYGFYGNEQLASVKLPSTLKVVEDSVFDSCPITEVHMHADMQPESFSYMAFGTSFDSLVVYISEGSWLDKNRDAWTGVLKNISYE